MKPTLHAARRAVVGLSTVALAITAQAGAAHAAVTLTTTNGSDLIVMTTGDPVTLICRADGKVATTAGVGSTVACAALTALTINGSPAADVVDLSKLTVARFPLAGIVQVGLRGGDDRFVGGELREQVAGSAGNDRIDGGKGDDLLNGGDGDDTVRGGLGSDDVKGGRGNDILVGHDDRGAGTPDFAADFLNTDNSEGIDVIVAQDADQTGKVVPSDDVAKWTFTSTGAAGLGRAQYLSRVEVEATDTATWNLASSATNGCFCLFIQSKNAAGVRRGLTTTQPAALKLTAADERVVFTAAAPAEREVPVTLNGKDGVDVLKILVPTPGLVEVTPTTVKIPGHGLITYSNFETVSVLPLP